MEELRLLPKSLTWKCDPSQFEFETTKDLPALEGTIGQDRALTAIDFGLGIEESGFNLFVLGQPGTGRGSRFAERPKLGQCSRRRALRGGRTGRRHTED